MLVAKDNEINQKLIEFVLRKAGGAVTIANNGEEAIRYLQQNNLYGTPDPEFQAVQFNSGNPHFGNQR